MIQEDYVLAKYHLTVAKRLFENYSKFNEKRLIVGVINELAKATSKIIRVYLMREKMKKLRDFNQIIGPKYFDRLTIENLMKILEIEMAQKVSPIEFARGDKIILLVNGKYKFLTINRLGEFLDSCERVVAFFKEDFRQI